MAKTKDYFGFGRLVSLILAIIPLTAWICGIITRVQDGKIVAAIVRIFTGWIVWILDLIFMIVEGHIFRLLDL